MAFCLLVGFCLWIGLRFISFFLLVSEFLRLRAFCKKGKLEITRIPSIHTTAFTLHTINSPFQVFLKNLFFMFVLLPSLRYTSQEV